MITQFQSAHFPSNNITLYIRVFQINMLFSGKVWRTFNWAVGFNKSFPFGWRLIPIKNICFSLLLRGWRNVQVLELKFLKHFFLFLTSFRLAFGDWLIDCISLHLGLWLCWWSVKSKIIPHRVLPRVGGQPRAGGPPPSSLLDRQTSGTCAGTRTGTSPANKNKFYTICSSHS